MENLPPDPQPPQPPCKEDPSPALEAYRVALLLTGHPGAATALFQEALASAEPHDSQDSHDGRRSLLGSVRRSAMAVSAREPVQEGKIEPWSRVAALPEPARSAFAFFQSVDGKLDDLAGLLDLPDAGSLSEPLAQARAALSPEKLFPADPLLRLHRPWGGDSVAVANAVEGTGGEAVAQLAAQAEFDRQWHKEVEGIVLPGEHKPGRSEEGRRDEPVPVGLRAILRQPAVMAIGVALLVMMGVGIFAAMQKMEEFPGKELINALIDDVDGPAKGTLEGIEATEAGHLGDWFLLKGFENFSVPAGFEQTRAIACRVHKHDGYSIAQVALEPRSAFLFVFRPADAGLRLDSPDWLVYQQDDWAVAVRVDGETCYVIAFPGDSDDMPEFLGTGGR